MKKLFGELHMSMPRLLLFAAIAGIYTGAVMLVPALKNTSFQDIGISYEWWVIFALIVVTNCRSCKEAMFKCFVFFLISQPLVYLVQTAAGTLEFAMGLYYYRTIWLPMTLLTLPGGAIAYLCKKQNAAGAAVLGLGNTIQAVLGAAYIKKAAESFPQHLLSALLCIASVVLMSVCIQKERRNRLIAMLLPLALTAAVCILLKMTGRVLIS